MKHTIRLEHIDNLGKLAFLCLVQKIQQAVRQVNIPGKYSPMLAQTLKLFTLTLLLFLHVFLWTNMGDLQLSFHGLIKICSIDIYHFMFL